MPQDKRATPSNRIVPHNNLGSIGVVTLAAKISLQLLPPNQPFFRMSLKPEAISEINEGKRDQDQQTADLATQVEGEIQASLVDLESRLVKEIGRDNIRANSHEVFQQLLVAGSVVFHVPESGPTSVFDLRQFVVQRDPTGRVLQLVIREEVATVALNARQKAALGGPDPEIDFSTYDPEIQTAPLADPGTDTVELYTGMELVAPDTYVVWQEILGREIEGTRGEFSEDEVPYMALRWRPTVGEHYAQAYVADMEGDLRTSEGLSKALREGALLSSRFIGGVRPDAPAGLEKRISKAPNGAFHRFNPDHVFFAQANKFADLRVTNESLERVEQRLRAAFLMNTTRDAERVTAEEIRQNFAELNTALGGAFAQLANDFQAPLLKRLMKRLENRGGLAGIQDAVKETEPIIITGVDAIGRNAELNNLLAFTQALTAAVGHQAVATILDTTEMASRIANATSVNPDKLVRSAEQIDEQVNKATLREAGVRAAGPAAGKAVADGSASPVPE